LIDCPRCGRDWLDHTLREMKEHHPAEALNLPFEEVDGVNLQLGDLGRMAGACVVRAAAVDSLTGKHPVLGFTFMAPDGLHPVAEVALVLSANGMVDFGRLVQQSIKKAVAACRG
jgi:hypothetical protein